MLSSEPAPNERFKMAILMSIAWLVVCFGSFAAGRLRGLKEALQIIVEEQEASICDEDYAALSIRVATRLLVETKRWAPWALWR